MNSIRVSSFIFVCVFGSALIGILLRSRLPAEYLSGDSKDAVKMGMGLVGTMVASSSSAFWSLRQRDNSTHKVPN